MSDITVYTSSTCPYCSMIKKYFDEKGVEYSEKNISEDAAARKELMDKGHMGVPVTVIGDQEIVGYDPDKLDELIG